MSDRAEGWYDDPDDGAVERFWDGSQWTGDVRQKYAPGWYDDPKDEEGQERYWDGTGWTHDVRKKFAPGWYEDPQRFGAERYWDGSAWTDDQRFVTRLDDVFQAVAMRRKEQRLVVSGEHLAWGDESMRWDDVTGFDAVTGVLNGFPSTHVITLTSPTGKMVVEIAVPRGDQRTADAFATLMDQAYRLVTPRILNELYQRVDAGQVVEYEKVALSPQGFAKSGKDPVPWNEYAGYRTNNAQLDVERLKGDKRKVAFRVQTTQLGRWVLTALLDDYAKRLAPN